MIKKILASWILTLGLILLTLAIYLNQIEKLNEILNSYTPLIP
ncbi:MAG: hypothetical protein QW476_01925 [Candidatus Bathyarchaeia archaeon]